VVTCGGRVVQVAVLQAPRLTDGVAACREARAAAVLLTSLRDVDEAVVLTARDVSPGKIPVELKVERHFLKVDFANEVQKLLLYFNLNLSLNFYI